MVLATGLISGFKFTSFYQHLFVLGPITGKAYSNLFVTIWEITIQQKSIGNFFSINGALTLCQKLEPDKQIC